MSTSNQPLNQHRTNDQHPVATATLVLVVPLLIAVVLVGLYLSQLEPTLGIAGK